MNVPALVFVLVVLSHSGVSAMGALKLCPPGGETYEYAKRMACGIPSRRRKRHSRLFEGVADCAN